MGRRQLLVIYLVRSGEGSVIDRLRGDDAARATQRAENKRLDKIKTEGWGRAESL